MTRDMNPVRRQNWTRRKLLKTTAAGTAVVAAGSFGFPAILKAQDTIRLGHITPKTGFLGQLGEYGLNGARMAVDEINEAGGILGREVELLAEDSVKPGVAVNKVDQLVNRDNVAALLGEISSATALAIAEAAKRNKTLYFNTGANSDALRGSNCNRFMFHVEGCNTMYTKTIGRWQQSKGLMEGARWYFLTADYAFGHDLRRVSQRFFKANAGNIVGDDLVPTGTTDYSSYILKVRQAEPDMIYLNLAGSDQTTFLKQYNEYGLDFPLSGGVMDTVQFWAAGLENLSGHWQSLWYHGLDVPAAQTFTENFDRRYGKPPDNQAWGDYVGMKVLAQTMNEANSTDTPKLIEHLEGGAEFDVLKARKGRFREWDHQLLQEMYVVKVKAPAQSENRWDIFEIVSPTPAADEPLERIQPTKEENSCTFEAEL